MADDMELDALVSQLNAAVASFKQSKAENARAEAISAARNVVSGLDRPEDAVLKLCFQPTENLSVKMGVDLGIFSAVVKKGGPITADELAEQSGASKELLQRFLRPLSALNYVREIDVGLFEATPLTEYAASRKGTGTINWLWRPLSWFSKTPEFLKTIGYKSPVGAANGPLQYVENVNVPIWDFIANDPEALDECGTCMEADRAARPLWTEWFPVQKELIDGFNGDPAQDTLIVDIAGGRGHDISSFHQSFPDAPGRRVLQDLPQVLDGVQDLDPRIEGMTCDFFKPQPIEGARIYYMKFILHDWSNEDSKAILTNIKNSMKKGYSKLILDEWVLPEKNCPLLASMWDLEMMACCSSMERTYSVWQKLLESAGLRLTKVWAPPVIGTSIIEADVL